MNNAFPSNPFGGNGGSGSNGGPGGLFGGSGFGTGPGGPASAIFEAMDQLRKSFESRPSGGSRMARGDGRTVIPPPKALRTNAQTGAPWPNCCPTCGVTAGGWASP